MKKTLATLAVAGSLAMIGTAPALAANYPPIPPQAAVSDGTVGPGEQFIFRGKGPFAGETLTIRVTPGNPPAAGGAAVGNRSVSTRINVVTETQTLAAQADAAGNFSVPITISEAGTYLLTATGNTSGQTVGPVTVVVDPAFASGLADTSGGAALANTGAALANTGADASLLLWGAAGVGVLGLGAAGVILARRNKATANA
ncbi:LPXTG cell wall anchor domain-containing protein [Pseudarthrobacter sp. H3Y2-7]|uniref:LPXTG cell wall anchor domain-containing protein n=1 Tax=Pseudarthrobacter naphthalenicus TaxID=3031328 RepID=UPI0023AF1134|nr:LPXTG cell wall anchor domain-containing protein [Pseudarthrobacter sp. H3Y2-7]MDE8668138.1 LPXTG cell wall anchor domain-containing protein [Pseudarthrobacter sp. H3Y2-7]